MQSESMFLKQGKAWVGALFLSFFSFPRFGDSVVPSSLSRTACPFGAESPLRCRRGQSERVLLLSSTPLCAGIAPMAVAWGRVVCPAP